MYQIRKKFLTYRNGLFYGDTAFKIGGIKLYIKHNQVIKKLSINSDYTVIVPKDEQEYARGYIHGYECARDKFLKEFYLENENATISC